MADDLGVRCEASSARQKAAAGCYICRRDDPSASPEGCSACEARSDAYHAASAALVDAVRDSFYRCQPLPQPIHAAVREYERALQRRVPDGT